MCYTWCVREETLLKLAIEEGGKLITSLFSGSAIVFPSEAFDPLATLQTVQEEKCTALYGVPTMFSAELELLQNGAVPYEGFQHLRTGIAAGSSVPAELMKKLHKILNLTELSMNTYFLYESSSWWVGADVLG